MFKAIKPNYLVQKNNLLNEIRANNMSLQELRFFSIYLSKINPKDMKTRTVSFSIEDFKSIMDLSRINIEYMKNVTSSLLSKVVFVPNERGGYVGFQLFKRCRVDIDENSQWYVEFDAHDEALPLMFEFKDKYFSYQLWNILSLKSKNHLRMYEILKQYEKISMRILSIEGLKNLLGIEKTDYKKYNDFKRFVLESCQKALAENTDITFTFEPYGKKGGGGKILFLKFNIEKSRNYVDELKLDNFISSNNYKEPLGEFESRIQFLCDAFDGEFLENEVSVLYRSMVEKLPDSIIKDDLKCYDYLLQKYTEMKMRNQKKRVTHRFAYIKSLIDIDIAGAEV